jgi:hypothetical protein
VRSRRKLQADLEALDRVRVVSRRRSGEAERDIRPGGGENVSRGHRLVPQPLELLLRLGRLVGQAQLELGVRDPELTLVGVADLRARLEIVGRDPELAREHPQRFHGRTAGAGLDPGDVRVRDARARKLAL